MLINFCGAAAQTDNSATYYLFLFGKRVERGLLAAVYSHRLNVNCADGNDVSTVLGVEIIKIGGVLEIVCVNLAAVNNLVGDDVVGVLFDIESDVLLCKNILCYLEYLGVGSGGRRNRDGLTLE